MNDTMLQQDSDDMDEREEDTVQSQLKKLMTSLTNSIIKADLEDFELVILILIINIK